MAWFDGSGRNKDAVEKAFKEISDLKAVISELSEDFEKFKKQAGKEIEAQSWALKEHVGSSEKKALEEEKAAMDSDRAIKFLESEGSKIKWRLQRISAEIERLKKADEILKKNTEVILSTAKKIEKTFNIDTLNSLKNSVSRTAAAMKSLMKKDDLFSKNIEKITGILSTIDRKTGNIETDAVALGQKAQQIDQFAMELKDAADAYAKRTSELNNKINIAVVNSDNASQMIAYLKNEIANIKNHVSALEGLRLAFEGQEQKINEMEKKLEYIDKVSAKTIVVD